jgi:hypothetical protein
MKPQLAAVMLLAASPVFADDNVVHDDGTGAQITFSLPTHGNQDGRRVEYTTFRIAVMKEDKFLLLADLAGKKSEDGNTFSGKIIIPSETVASAEILMLGSVSPNSSIGITKNVKVSGFKRVPRKKSWTDKQ